MNRLSIFTSLSFKAAPQAPDTAVWWRSEVPLILAAEMGWVLVAYAEPCARGIHIFAQHQTSCFLQPEVLLKLQELVSPS